MRVGHLVTYKMDHDAGTPAWIGIITAISDCGETAWVHWSDERTNRQSFPIHTDELMEIK